MALAEYSYSLGDATEWTAADVERCAAWCREKQEHLGKSDDGKFIIQLAPNVPADIRELFVKQGFKVVDAQYMKVEEK